MLPAFPLSFSRISGKLPLRVILVVPFMILLALTVGLTGWLSLRNGQNAVNNVAGQLRTEISQRIAGRLENFVAAPHLLNQLHANAFALGHISLADTDSLVRYFWKQIQAFPPAYSMYFGTAGEGAFYGANQFPKQPLQVSVADAGTGRSLNDYVAGPRAERRKLVNSSPDFDARTRFWYTAALNADKPAWSEIYADFTTKALMISAAQPVYGDKRELLGVVGSDMTLAELNDFLRTLKVGETGKSFIIERNGLLVASSSESLPFTADDKRIQATVLEDPLIRATAGFLEEKTPLDKIDRAQQLEFKFEGERQFLQITPWQDKHGLDWLIAVVIPEADFMAEIQANTRATLGLMLGALLLTGLIGWLTARWVVHPILGLNQAAARLAGGEWDQQLPTGRHDELGQLAQTFNGMAQQLRELFQNLEQKVAERTRDLTIAYKRLKASQAQLVQSEKMASLGQMVAGVAHEINTPLGYVKSNVEMVQGLFDELEGVSSEASKLAQILVSGETDEASLETQVGKVLELDQNLRESGTLEETRELFKDTLYGLGQIGELVTNLKNFSRLDQAHVDNVDIHDCIESSLNIAKNVLKHKVEVVKEYGQVPKIACAPSQINQVFLNLFTNAAQAIEDQGKLIIKTSADQAFAHISVQDTGKGIPKEVISKIFDPFFTTKPVGEGTGLGLSISFQIIRQHNGKIRVASEPGKGTRFIVSLPLKPAQAA